MRIRKLISILMITLLFGINCLPAFATDLNVEKVVFRNLRTSDAFLTLGGVRFYYNETMIESGDVISNDYPNSTGETDVFKVSATATYVKNTGLYLPTDIVNTDAPQLGEAGESCYYILCGHPEATENQEVTITFKNPAPLDVIEFVPRADPKRVNRSIEYPFIIDIYYSDGSVASHDITPIEDNATVQTLDMRPAQNTELIYDVTANNNDVATGATVEIIVSLKNCTDIYAEDVTVQYDPSFLSFVSDEIVSTSNSSIYYKDIDEQAGTIRYIVASDGADYGLNEDTELIKIKYTVIANSGQTEVKTKSGLVADSQGNEIAPECLSTILTIVKELTDVNNTGTFTLGDLAIASNLISTVESQWDTFTPDVDTSGSVDAVDLSLIAKEIIKN